MQISAPNDNEFSGVDRATTNESTQNTSGYTSFLATPEGTLLEDDRYVKGDPKPAKGKRSISK